MEYKLEMFYEDAKPPQTIAQRINNNIIKNDMKEDSILDESDVKPNEILNYKKLSYTQFNNYGYAILSLRYSQYTDNSVLSSYYISRLDYNVDKSINEQILKNCPSFVDIYIKRIIENKFSCILIKTKQNGKREVCDKKYIYLSL
jgi:hypothetical protein